MKVWVTGGRAREPFSRCFDRLSSSATSTQTKRAAVVAPAKDRASAAHQSQERFHDWCSWTPDRRRADGNSHLTRFASGEPAAIRGLRLVPGQRELTNEW